MEAAGACERSSWRRSGSSAWSTRIRCDEHNQRRSQSGASVYKGTAFQGSDECNLRFNEP
eukprot:1606774-Karenia_brevis.AAC.1